MKILFLLISLLNFYANAQEQDPCYSVNDFISQLDIKPPISYQLNVGWNMVGYTGTTENSDIETQINAALSTGTATSTFQVIKNVSGQFWSSNFAQITSFSQGEGYMMYVVSESAPSLSFNSAINIPEIIGCTDCEAVNFNQWANSDDGICNYDSDGDGVFDTEEIIGCQDSNACNFNESATDEGQCTFALEDYDCEGNITLKIGALMNGGIVFYIDEIGEHGLVASLEDIIEGSNMGTYGIDEGFEWHCYGLTIYGADGQAIGTGYQNTLDIVALNCQTVNGGITAAQATLNYTSEGFTDWYLPSKEELQEMHNTIGNVGSQGNVGGFDVSDYPYYWSSSEGSSLGSFGVNFNDGTSGSYSKYSSLRVRAVRAF